MITTYLRDLYNINLISEIQIHNIYQKKKTHTHNESIDANSMTNKLENQHKKLQRPFNIFDHHYKKWISSNIFHHHYNGHVNVSMIILL